MHLILYHPKVRYHAHNSPPLFPIMGNINLFHGLNPVSVISILMLSSRRCLRLPTRSGLHVFPPKLCMYVRTYVCVYVCIIMYVCMWYMYVCTYVRISMYACMYISMHACMYVFVYVCMYVGLYTHTYV